MFGSECGHVRVSEWAVGAAWVQRVYERWLVKKAQRES